MVNVKPVKLGRNTRMSFSKINEVMEMPNLIEVQKNSYQWFLDEGLKEVFRDVADITDYSGNLVLSFVDYRMDDAPKYTVKECKERDATYAAPLRVTARLLNKETGEIKRSLYGRFPAHDRQRYLRNQRCGARYHFAACPFSQRVLRYDA